MTIKANRIIRYYDSHDRDDEELSQTIFHQVAIEYLMTVIRWLLLGKGFGVITNVNLYVTDDPQEPGISPDIAVIAGLAVEGRQAGDSNSYYVGNDGPPPVVVFEISSDATWQLDLDSKLAKYSAMGVPEYFAFDPQQPGVWTKDLRNAGRLKGWRLNAAGNYVELAKNAESWLWSEQLDSWLGVDKKDSKYLRLYTRLVQIRLTELEAADLRAEVERQEKEVALQKATVEGLRVETERREKELALQKAETERQRAEKLAQKLRELGIEPE